jgi:hypothetical protein
MNEFPYFIKEIEKYNKTKKREKFFCWLEFSLKKREIFSFDKVIIINERYILKYFLLLTIVIISLK